MSSMTCPTCRTIRAPNAKYCHVCGHVYGAGTERAVDIAEPAARPVALTMTFWTAVKIGAGLTIGTMAAGIIGVVVWSVVFAGLFAAILGSLFSSLTHLTP